VIHFDLKLDTRLYDAARAAAVAAAGDVGRLRRSLAEVVEVEDVFHAQRPLIGEQLDDWFDLQAMASGADFWAKQAVLRGHIEQHLAPSAAAVLPFTPDLPGEQSWGLTVHLVPGLAHCYGPREGVQVFALRAGADPAEALLFLIHVYYHELAALFYTPASRRAASSQANAELLRHWLLLLIQNEGLANHVVLPQLLQLRARGCRFTYFTYAGLVEDRTATARAMTVCRETLALLSERTFPTLHPHVFAILKNPGMPVINLIGIHLAEAIARRFGEATLLAVADREPQEFFRLYAATSDPLCPELFGPAGEAAAAFGLHPGDLIVAGRRS